MSSNQPSAYYKTDSGDMIAVNSRGKIVEDAHYKQGDYRGWKAAGKGTKGYERSVYFKNDGKTIKHDIKHK